MHRLAARPTSVKCQSKTVEGTTKPKPAGFTIAYHENICFIQLELHYLDLFDLNWLIALGFESAASLIRSMSSSWFAKGNLAICEVL